MKPGLFSGLVVTVALAAAAPALGTSAGSGQAGPEYGLVVSEIAGGLTAKKPIFTCGGPDLTGIAEALGGPQAVQKLGLELVGRALGSQKGPWPRNYSAFTFQGRRWVPDFVKDRTFYLLDTGKRLDLTSEIRDLQAIARKRGGQLIIVTRRNATIAPALSKAASRWWSQSAGRVRILRCI